MQCWAQISEHVSPVKSWNPAREGNGNFISYIDIGSVRQEEKTIEPKPQILSKDAPSRARQLVKQGDVLVSTVRPNLNAVAVVPEELDGATASTGFCVLRPNLATLTERYLFHWVKSPQFISAMAKLATGASYPAVSDRIVLESKLPLPSIKEQRRIAAILDKADELRGKRRVSLAQIDVLIEATFLKLFGDPIENPKRWKKEKLGDIVRIRRGGSPRPIEDFLGGTINWIKIGDATGAGDDIYLTQCQDKIIEQGLKKTVFLKAGSLIFANCGVSLGFARILKIDGCIHDGWLSFEDIPEDRLDKLFLLKALNALTDRFRKMAPDGTQPNLNTSLMKAFEMILPPIELQRQFGAHLNALEKLKSGQRASLGELDVLFSSLQHRAFRGEL